MTESDIHHLAAAYALDAVDANERAAFEAHYPECDVCRLDVRSFRETLAEVATAGSTAPPEQLKAKVMGQIANTRQLSPLVPDELAARRRGHAGRWLAVAAALLLIVGAFVAGRSQAPPGGYAAAAADVLAEPDAQLVTLGGTAPGSFKVTYSPSAGKAVVTAEGLTEPGSGNAYELWLIDAAGPHPTRLLDHAAGGSVRRVIDVTGTAQQWGVTIEPADGSPAPTGDILFVG